MILKFLNSTKFVCFASLTVTMEWTLIDHYHPLDYKITYMCINTSSISFCFSSSSKWMYHLASLVFPARFCTKCMHIYMIKWPKRVVKHAIVYLYHDEFNPHILTFKRGSEKCCLVFSMHPFNNLMYQQRTQLYEYKYMVHYIRQWYFITKHWNPWNHSFQSWTFLK